MISNFLEGSKVCGPICLHFITVREAQIYLQTVYSQLVYWLMALVDIIVWRKFGSAKQVSMTYPRNVAYVKLKHFTVDVSYHSNSHL